MHLLYNHTRKFSRVIIRKKLCVMVSIVPEMICILYYTIVGVVVFAVACGVMAVKDRVLVVE